MISRLERAKGELNDLKQEAPPACASLSGAVAKRVRKWVPAIPAERLEFSILSLESAVKKYWRPLADMVHLSPKDLSLAWFMDCVFDKAPAPADSRVQMIKELADGSKDGAARDVASKIDELDLDVTYIRRVFAGRNLTEDAKLALARKAPLDQVVWWWDDGLASPAASAIVQERIRSGEAVGLGYGKLVERLMKFARADASQCAFYDDLVAAAQAKLELIGTSLPLEQPVLVIGDASASMQVCVHRDVDDHRAACTITNMSKISHHGAKSHGMIVITDMSYHVMQGVHRDVDDHLVAVFVHDGGRPHVLQHRASQAGHRSSQRG